MVSWELDISELLKGEEAAERVIEDAISTSLNPYALTILVPPRRQQAR